MSKISWRVEMCGKSMRETSSMFPFRLCLSIFHQPHNSITVHTIWCSWYLWSSATVTYFIGQTVAFLVFNARAKKNEHALICTWHLPFHVLNIMDENSVKNELKNIRVSHVFGWFVWCEAEATTAVTKHFDLINYAFVWCRQWNCIRKWRRRRKIMTGDDIFGVVQLQPYPPFYDDAISMAYWILTQIITPQIFC